MDETSMMKTNHKITDDIDGIKTMREASIFLLKSFIRLIFEEEDVIFKIWGKHLPDPKSCIYSLEKIYKSIINEPIDFTIDDNYIQFFGNSPYLKIPRTALSSESKKYVEVFEDINNWILFFDKRNMILLENKFQRCKFNQIISLNIDRVKIIERLTYMILKSSIMNHILFDSLQICVASLQNVVLLSENPDKRLLNILTIIRTEDFSNALFLYSSSMGKI